MIITGGFGSIENYEIAINNKMKHDSYETYVVYYSDQFRGRTYVYTADSDAKAVFLANEYIKECKMYSLTLESIMRLTLTKNELAKPEVIFISENRDRNTIPLVKFLKDNAERLDEYIQTELGECLNSLSDKERMYKRTYFLMNDPILSDWAIRCKVSGFGEKSKNEIAHEIDYEELNKHFKMETT